MFYLDW